MASKRIQVPKGVLPAIVLLTEHSDKLHFLKGVVENLSPADQRASRIAKEFAVKANVPPAQARDIVTQIMSFHQLRAGLGMTPAELFKSITENLELEGAADWKKEHLDKWRAAHREIEAVMSSDHPISLVQKSGRLRYEHQNILHTSKILTDIRPVFDESAREIKQMSVGYVLEIEFHDGTSRRTLFAALDAQDVAKLKSECERAEAKTVTLREGLRSLPWPILVSGDVDDD